ncbi:MAG: NERD domain-containing protein [Ramlibacter sp.]|nr:NERD domain-containing protein [Ramlibacter sp.]
MLIKSADDKSKRIALLQDLQNSTQLDAWQKQRVRESLAGLLKGIRGERDAAHYLDNHYRDSANHAVIHDLRIEIDGEVAQIDHLLINRVMDFYLIETKNYNGNLSITDRGEFSVIYAGEKTIGIPSPIEQSRRHENVFHKLLDRLEITARTGASRVFHHVVMLDPKATISRPDPKAYNTDMVIKADQFRTWHLNHIEKSGVGTVLLSMLNLRGSDALRMVAEKIASQHRRADLLALPEAWKPKSAPVFVQPGMPSLQLPDPQVQQSLDMNDHPLKRKLICMTCNATISFAEGKFCWGNGKRFGGGQYCRPHQIAF